MKAFLELLPLVPPRDKADTGREDPGREAHAVDAAEIGRLEDLGRLGSQLKWEILGLEVGSS